MTRAWDSFGPVMLEIPPSQFFEPGTNHNSRPSSKCILKKNPDHLYPLLLMVKDADSP